MFRSRRLSLSPAPLQTVHNLWAGRSRRVSTGVLTAGVDGVTGRATAARTQEHLEHDPTTSTQEPTDTL